MTDFILLGTDTDAGKTTFALLWLARYGDRCAYWKPVESGPSDSDAIARLVPGVRVHPPILRFAESAAPSLAASREDRVIPTAETFSRPASGPLLIETFGGPFSPLNETELQVELIERWKSPTVLACRSTVGAVGRTWST